MIMTLILILIHIVSSSNLIFILKVWTEEKRFNLVEIEHNVKLTHITETLVQCLHKYWNSRYNITLHHQIYPSNQSKSTAISYWNKSTMGCREEKPKCNVTSWDIPCIRSRMASSFSESSNMTMKYSVAKVLYTSRVSCRQQDQHFRLHLLVNINELEYW